MIVGKLKYLYRYKGISKNIDTAIDYVLNNDLLALPKGKTVIDNGNVIINRDTYIAKAKEDCFFENHEKFLDLQIVLKGKEGFAYTDISNPTLKVIAPYNTEKDVTKYSCEDGVFFTLEEGFALVYPEDIHLAKMNVDGKTVEKAVVKIKIEE